MKVLHSNVGAPSTTWVPRATRCQRCGALAREEARERTSDADVAIRYRCNECGWRKTNFYHESELD